MDTPEPQESSAKPVAKPVPLEPPVRKVLWSPCGWAAHLGVVALLGALVLFAFVNTLRNTEFALDNKFIILEDPRLRDTKRDNVKLVFTQDYWYPKAVSGLYRPLTTLSYMFNYAVLHSADKAASYHLLNLVLHWLNAVLIYFFVLVLMDKLWPALLTALLFALHPIVTESVTNIVGRADLFAMAAVLGAFLCYAKSTVSRSWRRLVWLLGMLVVTTLGVFCKESAVVVLPLMVLYDFTFRVTHRVKNWALNLLANGWSFFIKGYIAVLPAVAAMFLVRRAVFGKLRPPELPFVDNPLIDLSWLEARLTAIKVVGRYFLLLLWPRQLSCDYSYNQIPLVQFPLSGWEDWKAIAVLGLILVVLTVAVLSYRRHKATFFFVMFFFLTFLPSSNLVPNPTFGLSLRDNTSWCIGSIMAERFMYLPSIAYAGLVVIVTYAFCRKLVARLDISAWAQRVWLQALARGFLCVLAVAFAARTFFRNYDWDDDVRLWTKAAIVCPDSFKSHKSLAYALYEKDPEGKNIDRIIEEGEKAAQVTDRAQIVFLHLGAYYRIKGDLLSQRGTDGSFIPTSQSAPFYQKSIETLRRAVPLDHAFNDDNRAKELKRGRKPEDIPDIGNHEIYWNLGHSCMRIGQYDNAREAYRYMRHLSPTNPDACISLASVSIAQNKLDEAAVYLLQTLLLDNNRQEALRTLINVYRQIDREGTALVFSPGTQSQPRLNADSTLVRNHLCAAYVGLVQVFVETKQYELAQTTRQNALKAYNCPPDPFDQAIAKIPPSKKQKP
jgi:tetratricopeptide (TPR) repeat protein